MVTESQHKKYREDVLKNLRTAGEALEDPFPEGAIGDEGLSGKQRANMALASAHLTTQIMISERLAQISHILMTEKVDLEKEILDRVSTGENIVEKLVQMLEKVDVSAEEEVMVSMAEDWLNPEGFVTFAPPDPKS